MIYYIDNRNGSDENDGLSERFPRKNYIDLEIKPGDTVLFKRGSFYRDRLHTVGGKDGITVNYGAFGEGDAPVFCGSTDVSSPDDWEATELSNVWKCKNPVPGDVGNFVFGVDDCSATLRWEKDLLSEQGDFFDSRFGQGETPAYFNSAANGGKTDKYSKQELFLYSKGNPGLFYSHIEAVSYNTRALGVLKSDLVIEDLRIINSGVHGFAGQGNNITVRRCSFENIGGCCWNKDLRIRFGNGVEFWQYGDDILVEECIFKNVYDSCVTHQGPGEKTVPTRNFICRNNLFDTYGMAAFEYRDKLPIDSSFTGNICKNAGCGFAMLGEELPRRSEIWPQPMGHHIFLWRIPHATENGNLLIADNIFGSAPVGAAIYSIISEQAEAQITFKNNSYTPNPVLLIHFGGKSYTSYEEFSKR